MTLGRALFLLAASVLAGAVNSVAGGGTLLSFPAAIAAGLSPIVANATNAVALVPGSLAAAWAYRARLAGLGRLTALLSAPAVGGALIGATILRHTPQRLFDGVVPWLVLGATVLILLQGVLQRRTGLAAAVPEGAAASMAAPGPPPAPHDGRVARVIFFQFLVSIYGGYFGAAMGIVMLAFLGYLPGTDGQARLDVHQMNALKNVLAVIINGAASITFVVNGLVDARAAALMAAGAIAGGVIGGRLARRAQAHHVRRIVVAVGFGMTALLAWRRYG
jgi:uncharacterized membrane protein YfcA